METKGNNPLVKVCPSCGMSQLLNPTAFYIWKYVYKCKECHRKQMRKNYRDKKKQK